MSLESRKRKKSDNHSRLVDTKKDINWDKWNSSTSIHNYLMDDPFLDFIKYGNKSLATSYPRELINVTKITSNQNNFVNSLMQKGNEFETKVVECLSNQMGSENIIDIGGNGNTARSLQKYEDTIEAMNKGIPFIYQGVVRNYENKTYGIPDLLVRSDWLNRFLENEAYSEKEMRVGAPLLRAKKCKNRRTGKIRYRKPHYHYVVIDVKYKTLSLRSDGKHLRNDGNLKAFKSQILIYVDALEQMQGYNPGCGFILGSRWKFESKGIKYEGSSCFGMLGRIDYKKLDKSYIKKTKEAIEWLNLVKKEGHKWDLSKRPLPRPELYPNMCNQMDYPYHTLKKKFADDLGEISLLWYVGPKERRNAHNLGIYSWKDPKCTPDNLGIKSEKRPIVLNRILETNRTSLTTIQPKYFEKNLGDWKNSKKIELFVDFEMNNSVFQDFSDMPEFTNLTHIFMIGAGYIHPDTQEWIYKEFTVNTINSLEESKICNDFLCYVEVLRRKFNVNDIPVYHWSNAEVSSWKRASDRYQDHISLLFSNINWIDLLKVFQGEPVGVKGCLNYSLKTIAKAFHKNGFIKTIWNENSSCVNGADAAVEAYQIQQECEKKRISIHQHPLMEEIIKYNEVDCKVLQEILHYIRKHHVNESVDESVDESDDSVEEKYYEIFGNSTRKRRRINYDEENSDSIILYD